MDAGLSRGPAEDAAPRTKAVDYDDTAGAGSVQVERGDELQHPAVRDLRHPAANAERDIRAAPSGVQHEECQFVALGPWQQVGDGPGLAEVFAADRGGAVDRVGE